jgi:hypothetical protein
MTVHLQTTSASDNATIATAPVSTAATKTLTVSLVGAKSFSLYGDGFGPDNNAALGDPKVYCNAASLPESDLSEFP